MPAPTKSQAIVLHLIRQGDSSAVVQVIDSIGGRTSLFVRRVGGKTGRSASALSPALFHNLSVLDVVTTSTQKSSLLYLKEAEPLFSLSGIRMDICKSTVSMFISEVLFRTLRNDDGDPELFRWLIETIVRFDAADGPIANFHLWWLVSYCIRSGFRPDDNWSSETPLFDIVSARYVAPSSRCGYSVPYNPATQASGSGCAQNRGANFYDAGSLFSPEDSLLLHTLVNSTMEEALAIPLSSVRRQSFSRSILRYLSCHFGCDLDIKSLDVLHAVFA